MPWNLTAEEQSFRDEVRRFLDEELTDELREAGRRCAGIFASYEHGNRWHRVLARRGWSVPQWPVEHGGTGWTPMQQYIFVAELADADAPPRAPMGPGMVAPVIMAYGTPEQQRRWLPAIRSGEDYWCQGYSEPGAGSDLASLQCRAVRDGDHYVVDGTKIWTTHAHFANRIFCLVRTASGGKRQEGISFLCFDMALPGITVSPIRSVSGEHEVNQVFFDEVRVPVSGLVGEENQGWTVAKYLLVHERGAAWAPALRARWRRLSRALDAAFPGERAASPERADLALALAEAHCRIEALLALELGALRAQVRGEPPGASPSAGKVLGSELRQHLTELHLRILGADALTGPGADATPMDEGGFAMAAYLNDRAASIYAGANEVQRNLIAAHLLRGGRP